MKSNELRIGNWVDSPQGHFQIENIIGKAIDEEVGPIRLTPEILEKCGFEKVFFGKIQMGWDGPDDINLYQKNGEGPIHPAWKEYVVGKEIKYLHQLQNIFYALTQIELVYVEENKI